MLGALETLAESVLALPSIFASLAVVSLRSAPKLTHVSPVHLLGLATTSSMGTAQKLLDVAFPQAGELLSAPLGS
jgi:hypothetical protein